MPRIRALLLASVACVLVASPVAGAKPIMERVDLNEIGVLDEFLTDVCGYDVFVDVTGHILFRLFTDEEGNPQRELNNFGVKLRLYSEWGSLEVVDVGVDRVTFHTDGSITQVVVGNVQSIQLPGQGRVYSDVGQIAFLLTFPDPEGPPEVEVLWEHGQHSEVDQLDVICQALAA